MKALFISGEYPPRTGGLGDYTYLLCEELTRRGHDVTVLTTVGGDVSRPPLYPRHSGQVAVLRTVPRWNWRSIDIVRAVAEELRPEVVQLEYQAAAYAVHPAATLLPERLRGPAAPPIAVTLHDLRPPHGFPGSGRFDPTYVRRLARAARLAVCTDDVEAATVEQWRRGAPVRVIPIAPNIPARPLDPGEREGFRQAAGVADAFLVGFFGFANQTKGIETLIAGFTRFVSQVRNARLVFIGEQVGDADATNRRVLEAIERGIEVYGLSNAVHRTGRLSPDDIRRWLQSCDIVALPYSDGWSWRRGSLLAALANGCTVVTTTGPGDRALAPRVLPRLVHGQHALLAPPDDAEALAAALHQLRADRQLAGRLGEGGRRIAEEFSWQRVADEHLAAWAELGLNVTA